MQLELIVITSNLIFLVIGYFIGKNNSYMSKRESPLTTNEVGKALARANEVEKQANRLEVPEMPLGDEDNINHDGVGIIQRPTSEELDRFAEPQKVKEAKKAIAETIRNTPEPEI